MNLEEAICIVLTYRDRPQTSMNSHLRTIYQRALRLVDTHASNGVTNEMNNMALSNGQ